MLASAIPAKIQLPFAASGDRVTIPVTSQIGINDGRASFTTGFVPLNATPLSAGGVAPFETDFNGVLYQITAVQQWQCAGGYFKYDSAFSTSIGGYPKYAQLTGSNGVCYVSQIDNNTSNPETGGAGWAGIQSVTPPQFNNTNAVATMAAVRNELFGLGDSVYSALFGATIGLRGYQRLPSGLFLQWGSVSVNGTVVDPFYTAFPTVCYGVIGTCQTAADSNVGASAWVETSIVSTSQVFLKVVQSSPSGNTLGNRGVGYLAWGK